MEPFEEWFHAREREAHLRPRGPYPELAGFASSTHPGHGTIDPCRPIACSQSIRRPGACATCGPQPPTSAHSARSAPFVRQPTASPAPSSRRLPHQACADEAEAGSRRPERWRRSSRAQPIDAPDPRAADPSSSRTQWKASPRAARTQCSSPMCRTSFSTASRRPRRPSVPLTPISLSTAGHRRSRCSSARSGSAGLMRYASNSSRRLPATSRARKAHLPTGLAMASRHRSSATGPSSAA